MHESKTRKKRKIYTRNHGAHTLDSMLLFAEEMLSSRRPISVFTRGKRKEKEHKYNQLTDIKQTKTSCQSKAIKINVIRMKIQCHLDSHESVIEALFAERNPL